MVRFSKYVGSVQIQIILLKTENWKHYSKIIFKCVNCALWSIFIILFSKKSACRSYKQRTLSPAQWIHVHERCSYCSHMLEKKKKKEGNVKLKTQTRNKPSPNGHVVMLIFLMEIVVLIYYQIWSQTLLIS